jgi:cytochrome b561
MSEEKCILNKENPSEGCKKKAKVLLIYAIMGILILISFLLSIENNFGSAESFRWFGITIISLVGLIILFFYERM